MGDVRDISFFFGNNKRAKIKEVVNHLSQRTHGPPLLEPPLLIIMKHSPVSALILYYIRKGDHLSLGQVNSLFYRLMHFKLGHGLRILKRLKKQQKFHQESLAILSNLYISYECSTSASVHARLTQKLEKHIHENRLRCSTVGCFNILKPCYYTSKKNDICAECAYTADRQPWLK